MMAEMTTEQTGGPLSGLLGMLDAFVDPAGMAKRVPAKLFWLWPVITLTIIYVVFGYLMLPYAMQLVDLRMNEQFSQGNIPPERMENARRVAHMIGQFSFLATPVFVILFIVILAWLVSLTGSVVGLRAKFRDVFSVMSACSLILALQYVAGYIVLRVKGDEIANQEQLSPPFGVDIFLQDVHGSLLALLNFFSLFEIWYLVVLVFGLAYVAKSSKSKALIAITAAWLLPLLFRVVGAMFAGASS
jgi:Yip1-like protein